MANVVRQPVAVDLWVWPLDVAAGEPERLSAFLSDDERQRAARFVFARDQERFAAGRGRLRAVLGERLGSDPADLRFVTSAHGKPALDPSIGGLHFNLSHSEGLAALALCATHEVGLDIEFVRPLKEDVAARFFSAREIERLAALSADDQLAGFYRCWTRKEAIVKAIGEGLSRALDSFDVSVEAERLPCVERMDGDAQAPAAWQLAHFVPAAGFVGSVACRTGGAPLTLVRHD